jgi:hypothetical protein
MEPSTELSEQSKPTKHNNSPKQVNLSKLNKPKFNRPPKTSFRHEMPNGDIIPDGAIKLSESEVAMIMEKRNQEMEKRIQEKDAKIAKLNQQLKDAMKNGSNPPNSNFNPSNSNSNPFNSNSNPFNSNSNPSNSNSNRPPRIKSSYPCKNGPDCPNQEWCMFSHRAEPQIFFSEENLRKARGTIPCKFGSKCKKGNQCDFLH